MNNLKILRDEVGLSQNKLIEEIAKPPYNLKISRRTLQYWESGERDIKTDKAQILADYFNVPLAYLMGFSDSPDGNDKPTGFDSVEEYEKAKKELLEKIANNPNSKQIGIAHGADGKERLISYKTGFRIDYSMLIDFKYDEEGLSETKLKTLDIYNELNTEYKKMLFINAIDLIDESKESDILKIADNIKSTQIADENDRKMWLEEMEYRHKNNLPLTDF
ncbi:helix-turn-helix domain-containing protein [Streptococcus suis]